LNFEKLASALKITKEEAIEALKSSPLFLNKLRKKFNLNPILELTQHRASIFSDLDVVNVHIVKNLKPANDNKTQLVEYNRLFNET